MSAPSLRMATAEPRWLRLMLTAIGLAFLLLFLALPLIAVFVEALSGGWSAYTSALRDGETLGASHFAGMALIAAGLLAIDGRLYRHLRR